MSACTQLVPPVEKLSLGGFHVHMVDGDGMAPDLRSKRDYVIVAPVREYRGEGVYLVDWGYGPVLYRAQGSGNREKPIMIFLDNPVYRQGENGGLHHFTLDQFNEMVVGFVVADIRVRDERFLREVAL